MSLTARKDINIHGHISTNGQGPLDGPGAPNGVDQVGWGGSYGGSGGRLNCNDDYFSNLQYQVHVHYLSYVILLVFLYCVLFVSQP